MVGYLLLLKLLHCKRNRKKRNPCKLNIGSKKETNTDVPVIKKELDDSEEQYICRVCLKQGNIPIYENKACKDLSEALSTFGGIDISCGDDFPKYLCQACYEFLQEAILFRKNAQESDEKLRQTQNEIMPDIDESYNNNQDDSPGYDDSYKEESKLHCKKCLLSFNTFKEYSEHRLSLEHENVRRKCAICNKFYTAEYIKKHMLLHKLDRQYMCDICGKNFPLQATFKRHRLTHFYNLPFHCTLCPYKGRFRESLKLHMRTHTGEKPYQCSQCPSRFVNASNLSKHVKTHKRSHDFKCDMCGRGFYTKRDLGLHFKVDHTGIKEHVCNICGKAFGYRKQMMKHQLIVHKREKLRSGRMPLYLQVEKLNKTATD